MKKVSRAIRQLGALLILAVIVIGLPYAMQSTFGAPWTWGIPSWSDVQETLTSPMAPSMMVRVIGAVAWIAWLHFTLCLLVEVINVVARQGKPQIKLPGGGVNQQLARRLVAAALLSGVAGAAVVGPASAAPTIDRAEVAVTAVDARVVAEHQAGPAAPTQVNPGEVWQSTQVAAADSGTLQSYVVQAPAMADHDCLWDIADRHLGDPMRWKEIYDLNNSHAAGVKISDPDVIQPGWNLLMPADAYDLPAHVEAEKPKAAPQKPVTKVAPKDSASKSAPAEAANEKAGGVSAADASGQSNQGYDDGGMSREMYERLESKMRMPTPPPGTFAEKPKEFSLSELASASLEPQATAAALAPLAEKYSHVVDQVNQAEEAVNSVEVVRSLAGGLGAIAAGGLLYTLASRRRAASRVRTTTQRLRLPAAVASHLESDLRAVSDAKPVDELVAILQELARLAQASGVDVPPATMICLTADEVEIYCSTPTAALAPWRVTEDSPLRWVAPRSSFAGLQPSSDATPYPQLLSVGHRHDEAMVLVNLAAAGSLTFTGTPELRTEGMLGAAVELLTAPWSKDGSLALFGVDLDLGDVTQNYRVSMVRDFESLIDDLTQRAAKLADQRATAGEGKALCEPHTVLIGCDLPLGPRNQIAKLAQELQDGGVAVVTLGEEPLELWALNFGAGTRSRASHKATALNATLVPADWQLQANTLPVELLPAVKELLTVDNEAVPTQQYADCPVAQRFPGSALAIQGRGQDTFVSQERLSIQLFGEPQIIGAHGPRPYVDSVDHQAEVTELIAYLSLRMGPVPFDELQADLKSITGPWTEASIKERARMAKAWLGSADDGSDLVRLGPASVELAATGEIRNQLATLISLATTADSQHPAVLGAAEMSQMLAHVNDELVVSDAVTGAYSWFEPVRIRAHEVIGNAVAVSIDSLLASGDVPQARHASRVARILDPASDMAWIASFDVEAAVGDITTRVDLLDGYRESVRLIGGHPGPELSQRLQQVAEEAQTAQSQVHVVQNNTVATHSVPANVAQGYGGQAHAAHDDIAHDDMAQADLAQPQVMPAGVASIHGGPAQGGGQSDDDQPPTQPVRLVAPVKPAQQPVKPGPPVQPLRPVG